MRRGLYAAVAAASIAAAAALAASGGGAPPGASAVCRDGTYSFSKHHSGTCSHHHGVAQWLHAAATAAAPAAPGTVALGRTVLVSPRRRASGCRLGALPDRRCSPGAYSTGLTRAVLCSPGFHTGSVRNVPASEKHQVEAEYGLAPKAYGRTLEIDHIVSLELGGSNVAANLYPERANAAPGYHVKDRLENTLHAWVCEGRISLHAAQVGIATNWEALYRRVYRVAAPAQ